MGTQRKRTKRDSGSGQISRWVKAFIQTGKIPDEKDDLIAFEEFCWIHLLNGTNVAGFPLRKTTLAHIKYYHDYFPEIERDLLTQEEMDNWDHSKDKPRYLNFFL